MASYLDQFLNKPRNPQASGDIFSGLYNPQQIADLESQYTNEYGIQNTSGGIASDARHMAAMNNLSNSLSPMNNSIGNFIGDTGAFLAGGLNEIGALGRGFNKENFGEIGEDIAANFRGSFGTPNSSTAEDIYSQVFSGAVPQRVASGTPMGYGAAQASELTDVERDFPGMSTGDIIDSMNNRGPVATNIATAPQPKGMSYEQMVDLGLAGPDQDVGMTAEDLQNRQGILQGLQNKIGAGFNNVKDFAMNKGNIGRNLIGSAGAMAMGLPGIVGSGAMSLLGGLGNMFEDRQISGDGTIVDEYGNSYTADQLNMQNAKGGYYTDAARSSRRRTGNIARMLQRQKNKGLTDLGRKKLKKLQAQEAAQEEARQAATTQMAAANKAAGNTGGYQAGYDRDGDFMGGSGTAAEMGSSAMGGIIGHGGMGGKPAQSGLASMFTRRG